MDFRSLLAALSRTQYPWLVPAFGLLVGAMLARALRWRLLLQPVPDTQTGRLFNLLNIGYLVNNLSPLRLGDVLRAYLCAELERLSVVRTLSTVVIERVADTLAILLLLLVLLPSVVLPAYVARSAVGVALAAIAAAFALVFLALRGEWSLALFDCLAKRLPVFAHASLRRMVVSAREGSSALGSWRRAVAVLAWSLVIWLATAAQFHVVMRAAALQLPFTAALTVLCLTSLGMVVPSSPGYVGVFEYITVVALSLFAVGREVALGYALVLHGLSYLSLAILGAIGLWVEGYSYARVRNVLARAGMGELENQK